MPAPLLEAVAYQPQKAPRLADETRGNERLVVSGGLHYINGNREPYFSITATLYEGGRDVAGGCLHDTIEDWFPGQFTDLIAMHLSSMSGGPTHAIENGWYHLGYTKWQTINRAHAKKHFRINDTELDDLIALVNYPVLGIPSTGIREAKIRLVAWVEAQKPRWKAEADACIARHGLVVFGTDTWRAAA
jgi:hypothetical protein